MQLTIDGKLHTFIPLPAFRQQWGLPDEFCLAYFEPKNWQGLGSMESAGKALALLRQHLLEAIPAAVSLAELIFQVQALTEHFQRELTAVNAQIGLAEIEVEFAVAGFADVLQSVAYHLMQLTHTYRHEPGQIQVHFDFSGIYQNWLDASVRISATTRTYPHRDIIYQVQVIYNPYGRIGLKVAAAGEVYYLADLALACPALHYMRDLCGAVAQALSAALVASTSGVQR